MGVVNPRTLRFVSLSVFSMAKRVHSASGLGSSAGSSSSKIRKRGIDHGVTIFRGYLKLTTAAD